MSQSAVNLRKISVNPRKASAKSDGCRNADFTESDGRTRPSCDADAVLWLLGRVGKEMAWVVPVLMALSAGESGAPIRAYADVIQLEAAVLLITNPFGCLMFVIAPPGRFLLVLADLFVWLGFNLWWAGPWCRVFLILAAVWLAAIAIWTRKAMVTNSRIRQSAEVNKASSTIVGKGGREDALDAWEHYGSAEVRALIRQTLNRELTEDELQTVCRAVFVLAFLHGEKHKRRAFEKLKNAEAKADQLTQDCIDLQDQLSDARDEASDLRYDIRRLTADLKAANSRAVEAEGRITAIGIQPEAPKDDKNDKKWAVRAHWLQSQSTRKTGEAFNISQTTVSNWVKWCEEQLAKEESA